MANTVNSGNKSIKYAAFIPVRGGSKSIPLKNIKPICGKPLVCWTIEAALGCSYIDMVYVSTDSDAIRNVVNEYAGETRLQCIDRSEETATDTASTESAMLEFAGRFDFQNIILIQATSPLLRSDDLTAAIKKYENDNNDSILSAVRQKRFIWEEDPEKGASAVNYDYMRRPRRQEFDGYLVENGAFYITSKERLLETGNRISGKIGIHEMAEETYFEIDEPSDWIVIEQFLQRQMDSEKSPKLDIRLLVTDCDGCMTDAGMYYSEKGDELKKFCTLDGMGISLLHKAGIQTGIITGERTAIVENRVKKLKMKYLYQGVTNKLETLKEICAQEGIDLSQVAYVGDDINDVECIKASGIGFAVPNAMEEVKKAADIVLETKGGSGAIREAVEYVLRYSKL